jgi:protein phosphatase
MRLNVAGSTDVGLKRTHNEDAFLLLPEEQLYCVADGMGGHASGEVASRLAVEEMAEFFRLTGRDDEATWPFREDPARRHDENRVLTGVKLANLRIFERAQSDERLRGMGTTLVCAHFERGVGAVIVGHVGDSRAYLVRGGRIRQLTQDHSLVAQLVASNQITPEEARRDSRRNVVTRSVGVAPALDVDIVRLEEPLRSGDTLLLCSDGLHTQVSDEELARIASGESLDRACGELIALANERGGPDNITVALARFESDGEARTASRAGKAVWRVLLIGALLLAAGVLAWVVLGMKR